MSRSARSSSGSRARWRIGSRTCRSPAYGPRRCMLSPEAADAFFEAAQTHRDERAMSEAEAHEGGQT